MAEKHSPDLKKYISSTGSPMYYAARIARRKHPDTKVVFIGPCIAKRKEARRDECVDYVMTFEEIHSVLSGLGIEFSEAQTYEMAFTSIRTAHGFGQNGGVMAAVQAHVDGKLQFAGLQVANLTKKNVNLLKAYGKTGKAPAQFIEVMACEGGCISGPCTHIAYDQGKIQFNRELAKR